jgi:hypothetical protein
MELELIKYMRKLTIEAAVTESSAYIGILYEYKASFSKLFKNLGDCDKPIKYLKELSWLLINICLFEHIEVSMGMDDECKIL